MLYALRYESHSNNDVAGLVDTLRKQGINEKHRAVSQLWSFISTALGVIFHENIVYILELVQLLNDTQITYRFILIVFRYNTIGKG